jgi:TRAP-type mannitol/chloroaromatic compound transport system substrate-binding protein
MKFAAYDMYARSYNDSAENWAKIATEYPNVKIKTFPKEVIAAMKAENEKLLKETASKDPVFKKIYDAQTAYMKKARRWTEISDYAYLKDNLD